MSLTKQAASSFLRGDYESALRCYEALALKLGSSCFQVNIDLCKKRLGNAVGKTISVDCLKKYFEHVYVVNLEHHVGKRLKIANQLQRAGVSFELFRAVNGYVNEPRAFYESYIKKPLGSLIRYPEWNDREVRRGSHFIESPGAVGYIHTYLKILNDAKAKGFKNFLILEDDVILSNDFSAKLEKFMLGVSPDWKVLKLGASQYGWGSVDLEAASINGHYYPKQLDTCGSFAIAVDCSIIDELIEAESFFEAPFDHLPLGEIYNRYYGKCYVAYPNIIMPDVGDSAIRGERCQYTHSKRMKWQIENYQYPHPRPSVAVILTSPINLKYYSSFSNHASIAVELRLYYESSDGLRPLHNVSMMRSDYKAEMTLVGRYTLPKADFYLTLGEREILTESDIYSYLEFAFGLQSKNVTPLKPIDVTSPLVMHGRVSVVIPTFKRPKNLKNALISVLEQDYRDIEVLVVSDNGQNSPFNSETQLLISELKHVYPSRNLKLIEHTQNRNGAAARNTAIMQSTGEYICFLDDDDIYLPGRISKSINALQESTGVDGAVYCGFLGWNSPDNDINRYKSGDLTLEILMLDYKKHYLHTNTATYKREAVLAINGFDESYRRHQDLEFNLRFFELYNIETVKQSGVILNPEPSEVSNKVFNFDMLDLKVKFLRQFEHVFKQQDCNIINQIYEKHWVEAVKYINNKDEFNSEIKSRISNGYLQVSNLRQAVK